MGKKTKSASCCAPGGFGAARWIPWFRWMTGDRWSSQGTPGKGRHQGGRQTRVITWEKEGKVCCISLIKAEEFGGMIKGLLGPLMGDVLKNI